MDTLILIAVIAVVAISVGLAARSYRKAKERQSKLKAELKQRAAELKAAEARRKASKPSQSFNITDRYTGSATRKPETVSKPTHVAAPTQSVQSYTPVVDTSSNVLSDLADIAIIANTVRHWNNDTQSLGNPEPVREERSAGVTKSESSWGFDDEDSRKSVSSSFSSSWSSDSSSSSSSDSWSSSDSGPSSDW